MLKPKSIQRAAKLCLWTAGDAAFWWCLPREAFRLVSPAISIRDWFLAFQKDSTHTKVVFHHTNDIKKPLVSRTGFNLKIIKMILIARM